ncbi:DUF3558 family protein [Corynebacterium pseudotuberculosis]|uniref:DUF3558 family protein n=1 Tax=Corynebacterium pseudotuberculosis TaxID=1719 RepID=UPI0001E5F1F6|nr:DUF3558 family protein [Corynebacterium pseudotuberculosis]ADO26806.1 DUF3558 domain-containing protein [Corynebacterium pseudotuberculosis I19]AFF22696.1 Hypothetical protein CpP54B96_1568 [Corynebacterium pseudotuberculosis P54B96]AFH52491.1 Hypothetical protein Cp267_1605 [Corynebacterium pseudotuberculosis 267]AKI59898.1 DUF3558 domain-containing protein [Corynebacterium pseudotuberculosis]ALU17956.1 hypothetical protein AN397_07425 [Corynebacterium pseudotuberculosis]
MGIGGFLMHWLNLGTDSQQSYSFMRRHSLLLAFMIFCALMLTACVRDTAKESVSALLAHPTSENAHPDFPEVMEPNPKDPNFSFFDPCTDVPAETYERAGIRQTRGGFFGHPGMNRAHCHFFVESLGAFDDLAMVGSMVISYEETIQREELVLYKGEGVPNGVYFTKNRDPSLGLGTECTAYVPTKRGRVWAFYRLGDENDTDQERACRSAMEILKEITRGL